MARRLDALLRDRADRVLDVAIRVTRGESGGYRSVVHVRTARGQGERVLETPSCEAAAEASALVVALSAAPGSPVSDGADVAPSPLVAVSSPTVASVAAPAAPASTPVPAPGPGPAPAPAPPPSETKAPREWPLATPAPRPVRFLVGAGVAGDTSSLPGAALGPAMTLALRPIAALAVELSGSFLPPQTTMQTATVGARIDLIDVALRGCYERPARLTAGVCAGVFLDSLHAGSLGARSNGEATSVYWGPAAGGSLRVAVADWLSARILLEAAAPLGHQPFVIVGLGEVFRAPPVTCRSTVGLEASF